MPPSMPSFWTPSRVADLRRIWTDELLAESEIASRFGTTRSAISGKLYRMKLKRGFNPNPYRPQPRTTNSWSAKRRARAAAPASPPPPPAPPPRLSEPMSLLELQSWQCRPVSGERTTAQFCGCERLSKLPYCAEHSKRAYAKPVQVTAMEMELARRHMAAMRRRKGLAS